MRSNLTLGLAAIALGFGIVGTSAATIDLSMVRSDDALSRMQMPQGNGTSGMSAIKAHRGKGLQDDSLVGLSVTGGANLGNLVHPESETWRNELRALTATGQFSGTGAAVSDSLVSPPSK